MRVAVTKHVSGMLEVRFLFWICGASRSFTSGIITDNQFCFVCRLNLLLGDEEYLFLFKEAYKSVTCALSPEWPLVLYVSNIIGDASTLKIIFYLIYDIQHNPWKAKAGMKSCVTMSHSGPRPHRWWKEEAPVREAGLEYRRHHIKLRVKIANTFDNISHRVP